jgi:predicted DNA-binding transcriptional regulator AlpA
MNDNSLMSAQASAAYLNMSLKTLQRLGADGPPRVQLTERRIAYRRCDLDAWIASRCAAQGGKAGA